MKDDLFIKDTLSIPEHELLITTSRSGGPGGQHANKTNTRITVRWNITHSQILSDEQKKRITEKLQHQITETGDIIVHNSSSRSQLHNKKAALQDLATKIKKALHIPKKRMKTRIPKAIQETRLQEKRKRGEIKRQRSQKFE